jgi:hypothetical protein
MAAMIVPCPRCGAASRANFGQSIRFDATLAWFRSVRCEACGAAEEADFGGALPQAQRPQILREHGTWQIVVPRIEDRRKVATVAREAFALDLRAAVKFARAVPGVVWSGTEREMAWFGLLLARRGVVSLTRPDRAGAP